jgi:hypothetical protein
MPKTFGSVGPDANVSMSAPITVPPARPTSETPSPLASTLPRSR